MEYIFENIVFSIWDESSRELNGHSDWMHEKLNRPVGRQGYRRQTNATFSKALVMLSPTKLQTPKPFQAMKMPTVPEIEFVAVLMNACFLKSKFRVSSAYWTIPKEEIRICSDETQRSIVRSGCLKNAATKGDSVQSRSVSNTPAVIFKINTDVSSSAPISFRCIRPELSPASAKTPASAKKIESIAINPYSAGNKSLANMMEIPNWTTCGISRSTADHMKLFIIYCCDITKLKDNLFYEISFNLFLITDGLLMARRIMERTVTICVGSMEVPVGIMSTRCIIFPVPDNRECE